MPHVQTKIHTSAISVSSKIPKSGQSKKLWKTSASLLNNNTARDSIVLKNVHNNMKSFIVRNMKTFEQWKIPNVHEFLS